MDSSPLDRPQLRPRLTVRGALGAAAVYGTVAVTAIAILAAVVALATPTMRVRVVAIPEVYVTDPIEVAVQPPPEPVACEPVDESNEANPPPLPPEPVACEPVDESNEANPPPLPPGPLAWVGCEMSEDDAVRGRCHDGLPAISKDRKTIAVGEWDSTNADHPGFSILFISTASGKLSVRHRLFETEKVPSAGEIRRRAESPQKLLDDGGYRSLAPVLDSGYGVAHPQVAAWSHGDAVGVRDRASGWMRYQEQFHIDEVFGPRPPEDDDNMGCYPMRIYETSVWLDAKSQRLFLRLGFDLGCVCGEATRYFVRSLDELPELESF